MKRVINTFVKAVSAAVLSVAFVGAAAGAQTITPPAGCTNFVIYNTGAGSNNVAVCVDTVTLTVECTNNVYVLDANSQSAVSGQAVSQGNSAGGNAVSGDATNSNNQTVQIGATCGTPANNTSTENPTPGQGGVTPAPKPAALPYTAADSTVAVVATSLVAAAAIVAGSRVATAAYRHFNK